MFKFSKRSLFLLAVSLILTSCATSKWSYNYNNVPYGTPEEALAARKKAFDEDFLSKVTPNERFMGGSVVVIVPSLSTTITNHITLTWVGPEPSKEKKDDALGYNARMLMTDWKSRGELLEKRRIFDRVVITESDDPEHAAFSEDFALAMFKRDGEANWFLRKKNAIPSDAILIPEASMALPPAVRKNMWMDSIEKAARSMNK